MKWRSNIEQFWFSRSCFYVKNQQNPSIYFSFKNKKPFIIDKFGKLWFLMNFLSWNFLSSIQKQSKNQHFLMTIFIRLWPCLLTTKVRYCTGRKLSVVTLIYIYYTYVSCLMKIQTNEMVWIDLKSKTPLVQHPKQRCANILKVPRASFPKWSRKVG